MTGIYECVKCDEKHLSLTAANICRIADSMGLRYQDDFGDWHWEHNANCLWNPLTSYADCHVLIEWLRDNDWMMHHTRYRGEIDHIVVQHIEKGKHGWAGNDYRQGVVELTLKILDESDEGT